MGTFHQCPGSGMVDRSDEQDEGRSGDVSSQLRQWPVQMHLVSPVAPYYQKADVLLAADCVAYALGDFHAEHLKGKALGIACPKLDQQQTVYLEKVKAWVDQAKINTLTVMIMEVPCCMGLLSMAQRAVQEADRDVPIKAFTVSLKGEILSEQWV